MTQQELDNFMSLAFNDEEFKTKLQDVLQENYNTSLFLGDTDLNKITTDPGSIVETIGYQEFKYLLQRHEFKKDFIDYSLINSITETTTTNDVLLSLSLDNIKEIVEQEIQDKTRINESLKFEVIKDIVNTQIEQYGLSTTMDLNELVDSLIKSEIVKHDFVVYDSTFEDKLNIAVDTEVTTQIGSYLSLPIIKEAVVEILTGTTLLDDTYTDIDQAMKDLVNQALTNISLDGLNSFQVESLISASIRNFVDNHTASRQIINYVLRDHKVDQWICESNSLADGLNPITISVDPEDDTQLIESNVCECSDCLDEYVRAVLTADNVVLEGESIEYQIILSHELTEDLLIHLSNGSSIFIEAGSRMGWVTTSTPPKDDLVHDKIVIVSMQGFEYSGPEELELEYSTVALTKVKDDLEKVTLDAYFPAESNNELDGGFNITFTLSSMPETDVRILLDFSHEIVKEIIIPAGQLSTSTSILLPAGQYFMSIPAHGGGNFENLVLSDNIDQGAFINIIGEAKTLITIQGPTDVIEGQSVNYILELSKPQDEDIGIIVNGETHVINAGITSVSFLHIIPNDVFIHVNNTYTLNITNIDSGNIPKLNFDYSTYGSTTANITDVIDTAILGITGLQSDESDSFVTFELTLDKALSQDILVTYTDGTTSIIQKGVSKKALNIPINIEDSIVDVDIFEKEILKIEPVSPNYTFENYNLEPSYAKITVQETLTPVTFSLTTTLESNEIVLGEAIDTKIILSEPAKMNLIITTLDGVTLNLAEGQQIIQWTYYAPNEAGSVKIGVQSVEYEQSETLFYEKIDIGLAQLTLFVQTPGTATITIENVPETALEDEIINLTLSLDYPSENDITITFGNGQLTVFPAGNVNVVFGYTIPNDVYVSNIHTIQMMSYTGGSFENINITNQHQVVITDIIEETSASLSFNKTKIINGDSLLAIIELNNPAGEEITFNLNYPILPQPEIVIPQGEIIGTVNLDTYDFDEGVLTFYIENVTINNFESLVIQNSDELTGVDLEVQVYKETTITILNLPPFKYEDDLELEVIVNSESPITQPLTVTFEKYGDVIIQPDTNTGTLTIPIDDEDVYLDEDVLIDTITSATSEEFDKITIDTDYSSINVKIKDTITPTLLSLSTDEYVVGDEELTLTVILEHAPTYNFELIIKDNLNNEYPLVFKPEEALLKTINIQPDNVEQTLVYDFSYIGDHEFESLVTDTTSASINVYPKVYVNASITFDTESFEIPEGSNDQIVLIQSDYAAFEDITVVYSLNGEDFTDTIVQSEFSFPVAIPIQSDDLYKNASTVTLQIKSVEGGGFDSITFNPNAIIITITDNETPTYVNVSVPDSKMGEDPFLLEVNLVDENDVPVEVTKSSIITIEDDLSPKNTYNVVLSAGQSTGSANITTTNNTQYITYTAVSASGGNIEKFNLLNAHDSISISEVLPHIGTFTLTGPSAASEGQTAIFTVYVDEVDTSPITCTLSINGINKTGVIQAGDNSTTIEYTVPDDNTIENDITTILTAVTNGTYEQTIIGDPHEVQTTVNDIMTETTLSLNISPNSVNYDDTAILTLGLSAAPKTPLKVTLNTGDTITFSANEQTKTMNLSFVLDDAETTKTYSVTSVDATYDGGFEFLDTTSEAFVTINSLPSCILVLEAPNTINETDDTTFVTVKLEDSSGNAKVLNQGTITFDINGESFTINTYDNSGTYTVQTGVTNDAYVSSNGTATFNLTNIVLDNVPFGIDEELSTLTDDSIINEYNDITTISLSGPATISEGASAASITITASNTNLTTAFVAKMEYQVRDGDWTPMEDMVIPINNTTTTQLMNIDLQNNMVKDDGEKLNIRVKSYEGGTYESVDISNASISTDILDNVDTVEARFIFDLSSNPTTSTKAKYQVVLDNANANEDLPFTFIINYTEKGNQDSLSIAITVTIPQGSNKSNIVGVAPTDNASIGDASTDVETYLVSIPANTFEALNLKGDPTFDGYASGLSAADAIEYTATTGYSL